MSIKLLDIKFSEGYGKAHGTFGELLQGVLPCKKSFMVTLPISLFSYATFTPDLSQGQITVYPDRKKKSAVMAQYILDKFQIDIGGYLKIESEIPEGKGLASSSADLVATAYALKDSFDLQSLDSDLIASLIRKIEPTDGVMYPGTSAFYYKEVKLRESLAHLPRLIILGIDEGETVGTITYNKKKKHYTLDCYYLYENLLKHMTRAVKNGNLQEIGAIATQSARLNQRYLYKPSLEEVISIANENQALGVTVAHSGTFIGILLDPQSKDFLMKYQSCLLALQALKHDVKVFHSLTDQD